MTHISQVTQTQRRLHEAHKQRVATGCTTESYRQQFERAERERLRADLAEREAGELRQKLAEQEAQSAPKAFEGRDWLVATPRVPSVNEICKVVCHDFNIRKLDLMSRRRTNKIVVPRHIVVWIARTHTLLSYPQIGKALGGRDHTTSINSYRVIERDRLRDADLQARLVRLCRTLGVVG